MPYADTIMSFMASAYTYSYIVGQNISPVHSEVGAAFSDDPEQPESPPKKFHVFPMKLILIYELSASHPGDWSRAHKRLCLPSFSNRKMYIMVGTRFEHSKYSYQKAFL